MKRPVFLIIATVLIFILVGIWIYVLLYGNPENLGETFADFQLGNNTEITPEPEPQPDSEPSVPVNADQQLQQLTTDPVVGYQVVQASTSTTMYYYIEAGTGHIYSINGETGEEKRISRTTIPNITQGVITPNGAYILVTAGYGRSAETLLGKISTTSDTLLTSNLGEIAADIQPTTENTFLYSVQTPNTTIVKELNPINNQIETIATIPFRETAFSWGNTRDDVHYVYPKPSRQLEGYVYKIENGRLGRISVTGYGLSLIGTAEQFLYSRSNGETYSTSGYISETNEVTRIPVTIIPEKCTRGPFLTTLICAAPFSMERSDLPDSWHRGSVQFSDNLWEVDVNLSSAQLLLNTEQVSGRSLDISNLLSNKNNITKLLFQNKNDKTLWLFSK